MIGGNLSDTAPLWLGVRSETDIFRLAMLELWC